MVQDPKSPDTGGMPDKTTGNAPVSGTDSGGTRPAPKDGRPAPRPDVQSGDQNDNPVRNTDRQRGS